MQWNKFWIVLFFMLLLILISGCSSLEEDPKYKENICKAEFIERYMYYQFETEYGDTINVDVNHKDYNYISIGTVKANWFKKQEIWLDCSDTSSIDWGIKSGDEITWSYDIDDEFHELYGYGYVDLNIEAGYYFNIYSEPLENSFLREVFVYWNDSYDDTLVAHPDVCNWNCEVFHFAVIDTVEGWYKIEINCLTGDQYWIKESEVFDYYDWESYVCSGYLNWDNFPYIHKSPSENSELIIMENMDYYIYCHEVQGEWIFVSSTWNPDEFSETNSGWVRWRDGHKILIWLDWCM